MERRKRTDVQILLLDLRDGPMLRAFRMLPNGNPADNIIPFIQLHGTPRLRQHWVPAGNEAACTLCGHSGCEVAFRQRRTSCCISCRSQGHKRGVYLLMSCSCLNGISSRSGPDSYRGTKKPMMSFPLPFSLRTTTRVRPYGCCVLLP